MPTTYTNISKPSATSYTNVNTVGKQQYDQPSIEYDDSAVFYDGYNEDLWTDILKPTTVYTWADLTVTWSSFNRPWQSPTWILVNKP